MSFRSSERVRPGATNLKFSGQLTGSFRSASRQPSTETRYRTSFLISNRVPVSTGVAASWETANSVWEIMLRSVSAGSRKERSSLMTGISGYSSALMPRMVNWAPPLRMMVSSLSSVVRERVPAGIRLMISPKSRAFRMISPSSRESTSISLVMPSSRL